MEKLDEKINVKRAFAYEESLGLGAREAHQIVNDYTDQLLNTYECALNTYYRCGGITRVDENWNPKPCDAIIRPDRWTQKLTIEEESANFGAHQRYDCHCETTRKAGMGVLGEFLDYNNKNAYYFRAAHPKHDTRYIKAMFREMTAKINGQREK